jgi:hypothetical protein
VRLRGPKGVVVDVIRYRDQMRQGRRVYRLTRHGAIVGEYKSSAELANVIVSPNSSKTTESQRSL